MAKHWHATYPGELESANRKRNRDLTKVVVVLAVVATLAIALITHLG